MLELVRDCADLFVDNVIIASGDFSMRYDEPLEAHERDVTEVGLLVRYKPMGSSDKATIAVREVVLAGHGHGERKPIPGTLAAIEHWRGTKYTLYFCVVWPFGVHGARFLHREEWVCWGFGFGCGSGGGGTGANFGAGLGRFTRRAGMPAP